MRVKAYFLFFTKLSSEMESINTSETYFDLMG